MIGIAGVAVNAEPTTIGAAVGAIAADRAKANIEGAKDESTVAGAAVKATTGVSLDAIKEHGIAGGPNSVINNPLGNLFH